MINTSVLLGMINTSVPRSFAIYPLWVITYGSLPGPRKEVMMMMMKMKKKMMMRMMLV